jgi:hypothetical protein
VLGIAAEFEHRRIIATKANGVTFGRKPGRRPASAPTPYPTPADAQAALAICYITTASP